METKKITCVICPVGCNIEVDVENGEAVEVRGNKCPRGHAYASAEATHPVRLVTSTVRLEGGETARIPVKTKVPVPKEKMFEIMAQISAVTAHSPVKAGDVVIGDAAGTGVPVVITRNG